ncbi:ATP-binding protein [Novispirillum sp. DQ9]|uniref:ATP-binding protein n=1 Tax=Novispirillum sp. DQ9 TaxID=3398612 RepID=UPI003C7BF655
MTGNGSRRWGERQRTVLHALAGLVAAALSLGVLILVEQPLRDEALARARLEAHAAASVPRVRLEQELSDALALSHGLASLFAVDGLPDEDRFARLAAQALRKSPHIRNIVLSQGTRIVRVWPLEGNAAVLGVDYRDRQEQWPQVHRAMVTGRPVLDGPVPLIQGGVGLLQRVPVVAAGEEEWAGTFLGMLGLNIDVNSVLRAAGFTDGAQEALRMGLRGGDGKMIWGDAAVFDADPVLLSVALPGADWQLAATPVGGWAVGSPLFTLLRVLEAGAALLIGGGVFGLLRHRHQRREDVARLRASEERLRDAQRIGGMGAFEWYGGSDAVWWSDELYDLIGWERGSPVPLQRLLTAVHPDDVDGLLAAVAQASQPGGRLDHEYRLMRGDGALRTVRSWGEATGDAGSGQGVRLRGLVLDVTERALADAEREKLVARLRRSNQELERFATIAAHDLQEPLRQIASPLQLLQRRYADRLDADAETFIGYAVDGAKRMQRQILDLLDFSRLSTMPFTPRPVDLTAVLAEVRAALAAEEAAADACVTVGPLPVVGGDKDQLAILFTHLLRNALRYRKPGEPAVVGVAARRDGAGVWHLTVADAGIGVPEAFHDSIFDIFRRLAPPDGAASGIGLAMCRRIVERHDGRIWIESSEGNGAVLHVLLPGVPETSISKPGPAPLETS